MDFSLNFLLFLTVFAIGAICVTTFVLIFLLIKDVRSKKLW